VREPPPSNPPPRNPPLSSFPSPAKPPLGGWLGGPPNLWPCGFELATHPAGYNSNRLAIGLLRHYFFISTREECYDIGNNKQNLGTKIAEGIQDVNQVAALIVLLASINVGTLTKCVCDEFPW
jgi:hypothetical protein